MTRTTARACRLLGALAAFVPALASGQAVPSGPLDVEEAVRIALRQNPMYLRAVAGVGVAEGANRSTLANLLPGFGGSYSYTKRNATDTVFEFPVRQRLTEGGFETIETAEVGFDSQSDTDNFGFSIREDLSLPLWFSYKSSSENLRGTRFAREAAGQELAFGVRQQFYMVLRAQDLLQVQEEDLRLAEDEERRITSMFELGSVARADVLKAKVRVSEAELALIQQQNNVEIERSRLSVLLGLEPQVRLALAGDLTAAPAAIDSAAAASEARSRPDVESARSGLASASHLSKAANTSWIPSLFATFNLNKTSGNSERDQVRNSVDPDDPTVLVNFPSPEDSRIGSDGWSVQVGAAVSLDAFLNTGEMKRAKAAKRQQEHEVENIELAAQQELEEALLNYRASIRAIASAEDAVVSAEEDVRLSQERYQQGLGTVLELLEAQVNLVRARNTRVNALTGLKISEAALDKSRGAPLPY